MNKSKKTHTRSRSRSRSNKKRDRKKHRKYSSSSSRSSSRNNSDFEKKLTKLREHTKRSKKERSNSPFVNKKQIVLPNKGILASIILENIKNNTKLDYYEVERATAQLRKVDYDLNKKSVLMSTHINTATSNETDTNEHQFENGESLAIPKVYECVIKNCNKKFAYSYELKEHLNTHELLNTNA